jgi:2-dehydro-3-deoxygalactonokinase
MAKDTKFLSCDWGTTAFRLRLVTTNGFNTLAEVSSKYGIARAYEEWCKTGMEAQGRIAFYQAIIREHLKELSAKSETSLEDIPLIISGMASSNLGMMELPYKELPFALDGSDLRAEMIPASASFPYPVLLISGVRTEDDVMRGEEVQVVGCRLAQTGEEQLIIHPGTHCKHIAVSSNRVVSFKTFMTGELFSLFSTRSILAASVEAGGAFSSAQEHFIAGVKDGSENNLMHQAFMVRTSALFKKRTKTENFFYLSGILIGNELSVLSKDFNAALVLAGEQALTEQYRLALDVLGIIQRVPAISIMEPEAITFAGQWAVYEQHENS